MGDINIKQLESLRWRMRVIETLTVIGTAWIALAVYQKKEELVRKSREVQGKTEGLQSQSKRATSKM